MYDDNTKQNNNLVYSGGRQTGSVKGDTYYRTLRQNHFLKYPEISIAISTDVLDQLQERGVTTLEFKNSDTGTKYRCTLDHFSQSGVKFNRGYGEQVRLPLTGFVTIGQKLTPVYQDDKQADQDEKRKQLAFQGWF
jgi:hypothetical protein